LAKGDTINIEDIDYKRPGGGFSPEMTDVIIGRTIKKDLAFDHVLVSDDLV